jgi:hypothetical protein
MKNGAHEFRESDEFLGDGEGDLSTVGRPGDIVDWVEARASTAG